MRRPRDTADAADTAGRPLVESDAELANLSDLSPASSVEQPPHAGTSYPKRKRRGLWFLSEFGSAMASWISDKKSAAGPGSEYVAVPTSIEAGLAQEASIRLPEIQNGPKRSRRSYALMCLLAILY